MGLMTDAVIFDLFGTLIHLPRDTNPYLQFCRAIGDSSRIRESLVVDAPTLASFCDHLGVPHPANLADIQRELDADIDAAALFPDTIPTLNSLRDRDIRIAVISNLASPYKRTFTQLGLDAYTDAVIYSCDVGFVKPDARIYHAALTAFDVAPSNALMVGDSQRCDVDGPTACGVRGFLLDRHGKSSGDSSMRALSDVTSVLSS